METKNTLAEISGCCSASNSLDALRLLEASAQNELRKNLRKETMDRIIAVHLENLFKPKAIRGLPELYPAYNPLENFGKIKIEDFGKIRLKGENRMTNKALLRKLGVDKVIFNPPTTIVYMLNGSKGVSQNTVEDDYDPYVGLMLAIGDSKINGHKHQFKSWRNKKTTKKARK